MPETIDPSIFKAYDIRGLAPEQLDGDLARQIARAFVRFVGARHIAIGRDIRLTSQDIAQGFIRGATSEGCLVDDLGLIGTDMLYFDVAHRDLDGGVIVTASHNPKEWNGLKLVRRGAVALSGDTGIGDIREAVMSGSLRAAGPAPEQSARPRRSGEDYARHCLSFVDTSLIPRLKVVLDAGNGMGSVVAKAVLSQLNLDTVELFFEPDGRFPNHPADPLVAENRRDIETRVRQERADLGIAWDGDADRCFFVDDRGAFVPGDFVTALLGEAFARREPGGPIVYDVRASRAVADRVKAAGGVPLMNRVGHAFIKQRMRQENAAFGGEVSGHYYFRDNYYADNGMIPALLVLEYLGRSGRPLSEILEPLRARYHISGEINSRVRDVDGALARIEGRYADARFHRMDGLSVDYDNWHFNVRPSNTEPLLRLNLEAEGREEMERLRDEVLAVIRA